MILKLGFRFRIDTKHHVNSFERVAYCCWIRRKNVEKIPVRVSCRMARVERVRHSDTMDARTREGR